MEKTQFIYCAMIWEYCTYAHKMPWVGFSFARLLFYLHIDRILFYRLTNAPNVSMNTKLCLEFSDRKSLGF